MREESIEKIFEKVAEDLNITDTQYETADSKYKELGKFLDKNTPDVKIDLYPQGSFALGTIIKPLDREDEYDLDFVCEYQAYDESAQALKAEVQSLLANYGKCEFTEKRRCWQVIYENCPQFHMDIIPAVYKKEPREHIVITNMKYDGHYEYIGSNPKAYIKWFKDKQKASFQRLCENVRFQAKLQEIKEYKIKTTLQKAIQILKRHRDVMFKDDKNECKPISIIITTMAANMYNHEPRIFETITNFLAGAEEYLRTCKNDEGVYVIENPTFTGGETENFADKWQIHPERETAFFKWINKAKEDFNLEKIKAMSITELGQYLKIILGEKSGIRVFNSLAEEFKKDIENGKYKVDSKTGTISEKGNVTIPTTHHYGKVSKN